MAVNKDPDQLAIDVRNLNFAYQDENALFDVELVIPQGERILVIGANGPS
jgi:ABC-type Mn2+/Zn2+ transport system ATPase subunit